MNNENKKKKNIRSGKKTLLNKLFKSGFYLFWGWQKKPYFR